MASSNRFRLDRRGVGEILKTQTGPLINETARKVKDQVERVVDDGVEIVIDEYVTDRGAAMVTIADASGMEMQITGGALTRAAAAVGLEVTSK